MILWKIEYSFIEYRRYTRRLQFNTVVHFKMICGYLCISEVLVVSQASFFIHHGMVRTATLCQPFYTGPCRVSKDCGDLNKLPLPWTAPVFRILLILPAPAAMVLIKYLRVIYKKWSTPNGDIHSHFRLLLHTEVYVMQKYRYTYVYTHILCLCTHTYLPGGGESRRFVLFFLL